MSDKRTVTIYGRSNGFVCVDGDVVGCDEYEAFDKIKFIEFPNGLAFKVERPYGTWRVVQVQIGGSTYDGTIITKAIDDCSERITVEGEFDYINVWDNLPPTDHEMRLIIGHDFADWGAFNRNHQLNRDDLYTIIRIIRETKLRQKGQRVES